MSVAAVHGTPALADIDGDGNDPRTSSQPGQPSQGSGSLLVVEDLSRWHKCCHSFLLETIQRRTKQEVKNLTSNRARLMHHLSEQLEKKFYREENLSFLNLTMASNVRFHQPLNQHTMPSGKSYTPSEISVGSMSSQVSDSFDNDVQESTQIFLRSLQTIMDEIRPLSGIKRILKSLALTGGVEQDEEQAQRMLYTTIADVKSIFVEYEPHMHSMDFSDVGLELNDYEKMFTDDVVMFFVIVKREKSRGIRALWSLLDDKKQPWKPWKYYQHRPMKEWKPWQEYPHLQSRTKEIGEKVREAFEIAVATRDLFLVEACSMMNEVALDFAQERDIKVHDRFHDRVLLQREFEDPEEEIDFGI